MTPLHLRRRLGGLAARERRRGIRTDVAIPFDMFDLAGSLAEARAGERLEGLYHKGQAKAWNGKEVLAGLVEKHGGIHLPPDLRDAVRELFAVILWGELCAWKISAALALRLEPLGAKMAATSQAHDEARHFYVMHDYLELIGGAPTTLGPHTRSLLVGVLEADTLAKQLIGMQLMIEPMALTVFQLVRERRVEPVLSELLTLIERDEARHVALGVLHLPKLLTGLTLVEAAGLWSWEFVEHWRQFSMVKELASSFRALGIEPRQVVEIGRQKQIRANLMMMEQLGYDLPVMEFFLRFFDAKAAWDFPADGDVAAPRRLRGALDALRSASREVPADLVTA